MCVSPKTRFYAFTLLLSSILIASCTSTTQQATKSESAAEKALRAQHNFTSPPSSLITLTIPDNPSSDKQIIRQGKRLYVQNCSFCHQRDAIGKPGKAPSLTNQEFLSVASLKFITLTMIDGRPGTGMPPFSHLSQDKIYAIASYLFSFAKLPSRANEVNRQPKAKGDIASGEQLFNSICQPCHGPNGNGYVAGSTGTAIGSSGFLSKASDGFIRTTIKEGRSNTRMKSYQGPAGLADLSDKEIDDIISYLRSIPGKFQSTRQASLAPEGK